MKYISIIIIALFLSISSFAQDINQIDSLGQKQGFWIEKYSGLTSKGRYVNTRKQGVWTTSSKLSSLPQTMIEYKDDMIHGVFISMDQENNLRQLTYYENGKKNGISYFYLPNGDLEKIEEYKNDIPHGRFVEYYENLWCSVAPLP
jgi:antitoxin component YwqK of YwqJK toxin-antitoxin module